MAGQSAWDLIQPGISSFIDSFRPENVPVSEGWKKSAQTQNELRKNFQDYAPGVTKQKPTPPAKKQPGRVPNFGSNYKEEELAAGQKAGDYRKGAGFVEQTPTVASRDVQKSNGAKGTQTSPGGGMPVLDAATAAAFLKSKGIGQGAYSSIQLPNTSTNPDSGIVPDAVPFGGQEVSVTKNTLGAFTTADGATLPDLTGMSADDAFTNPEVQKAIASTYSQYGELSTGNGAFAKPTQGSKSVSESGPTDPPKGSSRLNEALADTAGMQSYMSKFGSPEQDKRRAADMAFLNAGTAQEGLRAKEAVLGQFHAGGQTYQLNDAGTELLQGSNGKPLAMDSKAASSYRLGTMDAQTYKDSYKEGVKGAVKETPSVAETPTTPKEGENPFAQNPAPATTAFPTDIPANTLSTASEQGGQLIDSVKGMDFTPPMSPEQISNSFLNNREPLMRDPRNK